VTDVDPPTIRPLGEAALLVQLGERIDERLNDRALDLLAAIQVGRGRGTGWLGPPVAGYASVLVPFDPALVEADRVEAWLRERLELGSPRDARVGRAIEIKVRYGGTDGPDLDEVARQTGLPPEQVIALHQSVEYRVYMLGFAPGFAYLGQLPAALEVARRATPRQRVPIGSVGIAARQTAVYPLSTPGGWQLIGRTDMPLWDFRARPPAALAAGDTVRFVAV
jgi:inhibitor of KinA